jgi:uncharacterized damage-inducible protein DinB
VASKRLDAGREFLLEAQDQLRKHHLPHIVKCLEKLSEQDIWWRPNDSSNSAGNLVLHLAGNVRQWIISGIGGAPDVRHRDREFAEQGPLPRRGLVALLRATVNEACRVLDRVPPATLGEPFSRQGFRTTRLRAILHVVEHFAYHAGQIVYITKLKTARDLRFTRLPQPKAAQPPKPAPKVPAKPAAAKRQPKPKPNRRRGA